MHPLSKRNHFFLCALCVLCGSRFCHWFSDHPITRPPDHPISHGGFQDKTALHLRIDPGFTLNADFADTKSGNVNLIREWPPIPSSPNP